MRRDPCRDGMRRRRLTNGKRAASASPAGLTTRKSDLSDLRTREIRTRVNSEFGGPSILRNKFCEADCTGTRACPSFALAASRKSDEPDLRCQARQ